MVSDGGPVRPAASWYQRQYQYLKTGAEACGSDDAYHFESSGLEELARDDGLKVGVVDSSVVGDAADNCSSHLKLRHSTGKSVQRVVKGHHSHYLTDIDSGHKVRNYDDVPQQMPPYCTSCN